MNIEQHLFNGDSAEVLKELKDNSVDLLATDPPYGIEFMGKSWDKVLPPTDIWKECYRVLKPGSFIAVMSSPRSDVLYRMIKDLEDAGFDMSFSPIYFTYHTGFPKASDTSKMIDKRGGDKYVDAMRFGKYIKQVRTQKGISITKIDKDLFNGSTLYSWYEGRPAGQQLPTLEQYNKIKEYLGIDNRFDFIFELDETNVVDEIPMTFGVGSSQERHGDTKKITEPSTDLAKKYEGSKLGFQPKPAIEHIIIGMKPHGQKSYIDNVLNFEALPDNIKMTYPFIQVPKPAKKEKDLGILGSIELLTPTTKLVYLSKKDIWEKEDLKTQKPWEDMEVLLQRATEEYGVVKKDETKWNIGSFGNYIMEQYQKDMTSTIKTETNSTTLLTTLNSSIENSIKTYIVELFGEKVKDIKFVKNVEQKNTKVSITLLNKDGYSQSVKDVSLEGLWNIKIGPSKTTHPTTKPVKLMSYIITLFTREGDWVLDPFLGSGTTGISAKLLNRNFIGVEREKEYFDISEERLSVSREDLIKFFKMDKDNQTKMDL